MNIKRSRLFALAVIPALLLAGCSGSDDTPTISGSPGAKPTITVPKDSKPPTTLTTTVIDKAKDTNAAKVEKGQFIVVNYLGQVWGGDVFDNSYDRGTPYGFSVGNGNVIAGWDDGLVGQQVGSRVELIVPPDKGYGTAGNSNAGISGTDTLIFVVDIIKTYPADAEAQADAQMQKALPADGPQVGGKLGAAPTLTIPKDAKASAKTTATVVAKGSGAAVADGSVVIKFLVKQWDGTEILSSWADKGTPQIVAIGDEKSPFTSLKGIPVGSRVLMTVPATEGTSSTEGTAAQAAVVDIIDQSSTK